MSRGEIYQNSICFSPVEAEKLNDLAFQLNPSLFFFAYYKPRAYARNESYFSCFRTAVTNAYGLLWDCSPHLRKLLYGKESILLSDWHRIQSDFELLYGIISSFRSIFCHNCSRELTLNDEHYRVAEDWIYAEFGIDSFLADLQDGHWQQLLDAMVQKFQALVADLEQAMQSLIQTSDIGRRDSAIQNWMKQIAEMYCKNPEYLLHTMAALYQWYVDNGGSQASIRTDYPLRNQTVLWLQRFCNAPFKWSDKWLDKNRVLQLIQNWPQEWAQWNGCSVADCNEPPLPGSEIFRILASDVDRFAANPHLGYHG